MAVHGHNTEPLSRLVLRPAANVVAVEADDGAVLVDERRAFTLPLNATGALLWGCLDGESPLGEICCDLAEAFGVTAERVSADVEALARRLLDGRMVTAPGYAPLQPDSGITDSCCGPARVTTPHTDGDRLHRLVHDGVWLDESPDACRDARFLQGPKGELVARLRTADGSERLVGIRTNDLGAADVVRERLGPLLADEPFGYPNISILLGARRGSVTDKSVVVRRGARMFHTFSREGAIAAGLGLVHTFLPPPDHLTPLEVRALERDGAVVLVDNVFAEALDAQQRRLVGAGYTVHALSPVLVDPFARLAHLPRGGEIAAPRFDTVPVTHLVVTGAAPNSGALGSFDLVRISPLAARDRRSLHARDVEALSLLAADVELVWVDAVERAQLLAALLGL